MIVPDYPAVSGDRSAIVPAIIRMTPLVTANEAFSLSPSNSGDAGDRICWCMIILPLRFLAFEIRSVITSVCSHHWTKVLYTHRCRRSVSTDTAKQTFAFLSLGTATGRKQTS